MKLGELNIILSEKSPLHNPERIVAPGMKIKELNEMSFSNTIDFFENRIKAFYLNPCEYLINIEKSDFGFTIISISFTILDLLSQYYTGARSSNWNNFEKFLKKYLPSFDKNCKNKGFLYHNDNMSDKYSSNTKTLIWVLWYGYRHGIIHNGKTMSYAQYDFFQKDLYQEKSWKDSYNNIRYEFWLNPVKFYEEVKKGYSSYINDLRNSKPSMIIYKGFFGKFKIDFGFGY